MIQSNDQRSLLFWPLKNSWSTFATGFFDFITQTTFNSQLID